MTVYSTGTVSVTNGSTTVTGTLTDWSAALLTAGARFDLAGASYPIVAVVSDTELTLGLPFAGSTASGLSYAISRVEALPQQTALNAATIAQLLRGMPAHSILGKALAQAADEADGRALLGLGADAMSFEFDAGSTTMADPAAGYFRANNATAASATALAISATDQDGNDLSDFFLSRLSSTSTPKAHLAITYGAERIEFAVTAVTDNGSWLQLTVQEGLDTDALADTDMGAFTFWSAGNKGDYASASEVGDYLEPLLLSAGLPTRLGVISQNISGGDWDDATSNGWWVGSNCANSPDGSSSWFMGIVEVYTTTYVTQTLHAFTADGATDTRLYRRSRTGGVWSIWYRCRIAEAELDARYATLATAQTIAGVKTFSTAPLLDGATVRNIAQGSAYGQLKLQPGTSGQTGYAEFYLPGGTRVGYIGYAGAGGYIKMIAENGALGYDMSGSLLVGGYAALTTNTGVQLTGTQTIGGAKTFSTIVEGSAGLRAIGSSYVKAGSAVSNAHFWFQDSTGATKGLIYTAYSSGHLHIVNYTTGGQVALSITDAGLLVFKGQEVRDKSNTPDGSLALAEAGTDTVVRPWSAAHLDGVRKFRSYTVGTAPSASAKGAGYEIYVSNETGGAIPAFSDGTNWRRVNDRAIIS